MAQGESKAKPIFHTTGGHLIMRSSAFEYDIKFCFYSSAGG